MEILKQLQFVLDSTERGNIPALYYLTEFVFKVSYHFELSVT